MLNKGSKTTNIESLKVNDQDVVDDAEIAQSMKKFFCSVGEKLSDDIPQQPNPLLSNEYGVNQSGTQFRFEAVSPVGAERALEKMKISFGFGSDGIASHFLKIAFPVISFFYIYIPIKRYNIFYKLHYTTYRNTLQYKLHYTTYKNDSTILLQRCPEEQKTMSTQRPLNK